MILSVLRGKNVKKISLSVLFLLIFQGFSFAQEFSREWLAKNVGLPHEETAARSARSSVFAPPSANKSNARTVAAGQRRRKGQNAVKRSGKSSVFVQKSVAQRPAPAHNAARVEKGVKTAASDDDTAKIEAYLAQRPDLLPDLPTKKD